MEVVTMVDDAQHSHGICIVLYKHCSYLLSWSTPIKNRRDGGETVVIIAMAHFHAWQRH
jgi:hypothetical protein